MFFGKKMALILSALALNFICFQSAQAMPLGTLLYRTSGDGKLYGYNTEDFLTIKNKRIDNIYSGHVAIYIGRENDVDYIVEASSDGLVKTPAKYFLNTNNNEKLLGAKIPKNLSEIQRMKIVELAKTLANSNLAYDFDFKKQKGPDSGTWTCVGLTEKIYESANIFNPLDLSELEYDSNNYAINITPDGFDNFSIVNQETGDCLSKNLEFSKISAIKKTIIPLSEIFGFNAGLEYKNERYFFFPLTQYYQDDLRDVEVDIDIGSGFSDSEIRGDIPKVAMIFRWTLINYPSSAIKKIINNISNKEEVVIDDSIIDEEYNSSSDFNDIATGSVENISESSPITKVSELVLGKIKSLITVEDNEITDFNSDINNDNEDENENTNDNSDNVVIDNNEDNNSNENNNSNNENNNNETEEHQNEEEDENIDNNEDESDYYSILANKIVISRIYSTLSNDYIELYNPTTVDIDLEEFNFRLYKVKTSAIPSLMVRIGNTDDGSYPGGTIIKAKSRYLIVRSSAENSLKSSAQAIVTKDNFSFTGDAYTIYLSRGAVSNDNDEDIVDKVGYGGAKYYEKYPASEIFDDYVLVRKAKSDSNSWDMSESGNHYSLGNSYDSNNNNFDFVLVSLINEDNNSNENNDNNSDNENNSDSNNENDINNNDNSNNEINNSSTIENKEDPENNINDLEKNKAKSLLISRIYTTLTDDYVELYNPSSESINLATSGIRLYKTKTGSGPYLMARLGNPIDGYYSGSLIIGSHEKYLIARASSSDDIKSKAQTVINRSNFNLSGDAYTVYLSSDPVSSDDDEDIIDKVGYGDAIYYYTSPASAISNNCILTRKALSTSTAFDMSELGSHYSLGNSFNSKNNNFDFVLVCDDSEEVENNNTTTIIDDINDNEEEDGETEEENINTSSSEIIYSDELESGYCIDPGLYLDGIIHLWHLDECEGTLAYDFVNNQASNHSSIWQEGKFGCSLKQYFSHDYISTKLDSSFDPNNFSLSFYYKNIMDNSRPYLLFYNSLTQSYFSIRLYPSYTDIYNMPGLYWNQRLEKLVWPSDDDWHLFTLVVNKNFNYWSLYRDAEEVLRVNMENNFLVPVDTFSIRGENGYNLMDEIVIFNRALSSEEITYIYNFDLPLNPISCYPVSSRLAELTNYWSFNEYAGNLAFDIFGLSHLNMSSSSRIINESGNNNLSVMAGDNGVLVDFLRPFYYKNISLSFWRKSDFTKLDSDFSINLLADDQKILGFDLSYNNLYYYFNNFNFKVNFDNISTLLSDNLWHQYILVYDAYNLRLKLYIDGQLIAYWNKNWLNPIPIDSLNIYSQEENSIIDELGIWNGTLKEEEIEYLYEKQKDFFIK